MFIYLPPDFPRTPFNPGINPAGSALDLLNLSNISIPLTFEFK